MWPCGCFACHDPFQTDMPLDTRAFIPFKILLQKAYQACRIRAAGGRGACCRLAGVFLHRSPNGLAGAVLGYSLNQAGLSERTKAALGMDAALRIGTAEPSMDQLRLCFPKRSKVRRRPSGRQAKLPRRLKLWSLL